MQFLSSYFDKVSKTNLKPVEKSDKFEYSKIKIKTDERMRIKSKASPIN